ncbi:MAG: hypothetical protein KAT77_05015 [Nanoarchaeota archaeon]|nr:hypothetical protein [Nanoarchaeota archaeon]
MKKLFGKKPAPPPAPAIDAVQINNRLGLVEEKLTNLNKKFEVLEKNMLDGFKKINSDLRSFDSEVLDIKREVNGIKQKLDLVIKELKMTAGKDELNTIQKYLDLWNPVKFATRDYVEKIIDEKLKMSRSPPAKK